MRERVASRGSQFKCTARIKSGPLSRSGLNPSRSALAQLALRISSSRSSCVRPAGVRRASLSLEGRGLSSAGVSDSARPGRGNEVLVAGRMISAGLRRDGRRGFLFSSCRTLATTLVILIARGGSLLTAARIISSEASWPSFSRTLLTNASAILSVQRSLFAIS